MTHTDTTGTTTNDALPRVFPQRCVHTKLTKATCRRCIDVCPVGAWVIDDDAMAIDTSRCDGCGLCATTCPQGAIISDRLLRALELESPQTDAINLACEYAGVDARQGVIPCLHAIGQRELLQLYRLGIRVLNVACGDCTRCIRSCATSLCDYIEAINGMLSNRDMARLSLQVIPANTWTPSLQATRRSADVPVLNRRNFFRSVAASTLDWSGDWNTDQPGQGFIPPGKILPRSQAAAIVPYVPHIDATRCNGCDACAHLCPQGAITLHANKEQINYRVDAECCTGCAICVDACTERAVSVDSWQSQRQFRLDLTAQVCPACGTPYHVPVGQTHHKGLCSVCTQVNHARNLYQTIETAE